MKKTTMKAAGLVLGALLFVSCNKNECAECHYDATDSTEVELGQKCGDELETLEADGYSDGTNTYTVHCGEDHE